MSDECERFDALPSAERTLLWVMRVWVIGHIRQQDVAGRIGAALTDVGAECAQPCLDGFMWALSRGARRPLHILCLCRTEVSDDERVLLNAFALLQQDEAVEALTGLCSLLSDAAASVALRSAEGVADAFVLAGIALPWDVAVVSRSAVPAVRVLH